MTCFLQNKLHQLVIFIFAVTDNQFYAVYVTRCVPLISDTYYHAGNN